MAVNLFNEKAGDPRWDNDARRANRALTRVSASLRFTGYRNRKRKKLMKRVEGARYIEFVVAVANQRDACELINGVRAGLDRRRKT